MLGVTPEAPLNNAHLKQHYQCRTGSDKVSAHTAGLSLPGEGLLCSLSFMPLLCLPQHPQHPTESQAATGTSSATSCHVQDGPALELLRLPALQHTSLHPWPGTPKHLLAGPSQQRGPAERALPEWLWCAGSEPKGRSAVESPSHPRPLKNFFRICC